MNMNENKGVPANDVLRSYLASATPQMNEEAVIQGEHWRIGILSEALVRVEWSESGLFEDRPTQIVMNRSFGRTPKFHVTHNSDNLVVIETPALTLSYNKKPFSSEGLSVAAKRSTSHYRIWHYGDGDHNGNLGGTARTLDQCDGATTLDKGVASRHGWAVIDDSRSNVWRDMPTIPDGPSQGKANPYGVWLTPRSHQETDIYIFAHGNEYASAVQDLYRLTGPQPLLPRWALGNWWSRYYRYSQSEYEQLMRGFCEENLPFSVAVLDMDWHLVDIPAQYGHGWTGYTWNKELFPDPPAFLKSLHDMGMHVTLNDHPRDGYRSFEDGYAEAAQAMGIDPDSGATVNFDIADPLFLRTSMHMHHRLEKQGVDFWWIDWQQGSLSREPGLDPLWMLDHAHYCDSGRDGHWPLTFSRYAGVGSHRYPVGFSGDTVISWDSLKFQPYFTATASNVGYGWWSHDIGGHMLGTRDDELEARWFWLGAFSPINRLHSSASDFLTKDPRSFAEPARSSMSAALRFRQRMLPYLYSMNWRAHEAGLPVVEPLYWVHSDPEAYAFHDEFYFGTQLLVAPIVDPADEFTGMGSAQVWLPAASDNAPVKSGEMLREADSKGAIVPKDAAAAGDTSHIDTSTTTEASAPHLWFDIFTGRAYEAPQARHLCVFRPLNQIPVFARSGAVLPLLPDTAQALQAGTSNPRALEVLLAPGASGSFELVEDDGIYQHDSSQIHTARTRLTWNWQAGTFHVSSPQFSSQQQAGILPDSRSWCVCVRGVARPDNLEQIRAYATNASGQCSEVAAHASYDERTLSLLVSCEAVESSAELDVDLPDLKIATNPLVSDAFDVLNRAKINTLTKDLAMNEISRFGVGALASFAALERDNTREQVAGEPPIWKSHMPSTVIAALAEVLTRS